MNKITNDFLNSQIADVKFHRIDDTTITIAIITLRSGFTVTGESACVDPSNFDAEIGNKIAYDNAFEKLWQLFGFELKQRIGGNFLYRLRRERDELAERYEKLSYALDNETIITTPEELSLLKEQRELMGEYLEILNKRLESKNEN